MTKSPTDRTEEEEETLRKYQEEQERLEKEYKEKEAARKKESNELAAAYFKKINAGNNTNAGNNIAWFMKQAKQRMHRYEPIRITNPDVVGNLQAMMKYAYQLEVERRGKSMIEDEYTNRAVSVICRWMCNHDKPGLILRGYIGVGKTTMMFAMQCVYSVVEKKNMTIVDAQRITNASRDSQTQFKEYAECEMLGIDDLGTEPVDIKKYGNECSPISELLIERYNHRRFTIITTNLTKEEIKETYGERLFDRFKEMFNTVSYDPEQKSYRQ